MNELRLPEGRAYAPTTVDMRTKELVPERDRGYLAVDLFQTTLFAEKKVGDNGAFSISGRRSYADVILNPILDSFNVNIRAPRYYDFQTRYLHQSPKHGTFDAFFMLSDDRFAILGDSDEEDHVDEEVELLPVSVAKECCQ